MNNIKQIIALQFLRCNDNLRIITLITIVIFVVYDVIRD